MSIETITLNNGEEFKFDTSSNEFVNARNVANLLGIIKADETFFFARNLEFIRQKVFTPIYPELKLLNSGLLPINTSIPEGAETDTYDVLDSTGEAKIIADFAKDIPTVEVFGNEYTNKIKSLADSYIYSVQDMRKDKMLGNQARSVITNKALSARKAVDQKIEKFLAFGDSTNKITGLFNNSNVPINIVAPTGSGSSTLWADKTTTNILADIQNAIANMVDLTQANEKPTHMLLDYTNYNLIETRALDTTHYSGETILGYIKRVHNLTVDWVFHLKNGFINNTQSGFVLYNNSEEKVEGVLPIRLMVHPPQAINLATKNIIEARCGGTRIFYPYSVSYNYGI